MLKNVLKKNPDIVNNSDIEFFGKYRPALQNHYKRQQIEKLLKDVDDIDKNRYRKFDEKVFRIFRVSGESNVGC